MLGNSWAYLCVCVCVGGGGGVLGEEIQYQTSDGSLTALTDVFVK